MIEICGTNIINYMVPLSRQTDFFVPEMKEEVQTDVKEEDSDEDRGTDITGKRVAPLPLTQGAWLACYRTILYNVGCLVPSCDNILRVTDR